MANFEAFRCNFSMSTNSEIGKSDILVTSIAATHKSTNDRRKSESSRKYHNRIAERPSIKKRLLSFFRFRYYYYPSERQGAVGNAIICPGEISRHCIRPTWHSKHFRKPAKKNWRKKLFANAKFFICHPCLL